MQHCTGMRRTKALRGSYAFRLEELCASRATSSVPTPELPAKSRPAEKAIVIMVVWVDNEEERVHAGKSLKGLELLGDILEYTVDYYVLFKWGTHGQGKIHTKFFPVRDRHL